MPDPEPEPLPRANHAALPTGRRCLSTMPCMSICTSTELLHSYFEVEACVCSTGLQTSTAGRNAILVSFLVEKIENSGFGLLLCALLRAECR